MSRSLWIFTLTGCLQATASLSAQTAGSSSSPALAPKVDATALVAPVAPQEGVWRARRDDMPPAKAPVVPANLPGGDWKETKRPFVARGVSADPTSVIAPSESQEGWHARQQEIIPVAATSSGSVRTTGWSTPQPISSAFSNNQTPAAPTTNYYSTVQPPYAQPNNSSGPPPVPPPYPQEGSALDESTAPSQPIKMHRGQTVDPQYGLPPAQQGPIEMPGMPMQQQPLHAMPDSGMNQMPHDAAMHPMPSDPEMHQIPVDPNAPPKLSDQVTSDGGYWKTCEYPTLPRLTLSAEAMVWFLKDAPFHDPVVTSSRNPADLGFLNMPTTGILLGQGDYNLDRIYGSRLTADLRVCDLWHVEASGFALQDSTRSFSAQSLGFGLPLLAIPVVNNGVNSAIVLAAPGINSGGASSQLTTEFWALRPTSRTIFALAFIARSIPSMACVISI